jgi:hypothetical protein
VDIVSIALHDSTNLTGVYKTGYATSGLYNVEFSKPGYYSKIFSVQLNNGIETVLDVQLVDTAFNGIDEFQVDNWIQIENNPSSTEIKLMLSPLFFKSAPTVSLQVMDVTGRTVYEKNNIEKESVILRKSEVGAGNYFFSVSNEKGFIGKGKLIFQ